MAAHLLQDGADIRTVRELLRHGDVKATIIYTPGLDGLGREPISPLDRSTVAKGAGGEFCAQTGDFFRGVV